MYTKHLIAGLLFASKIENLQEPTEQEFGSFNVGYQFYRYDTKDGAIVSIVPFSDRLSAAENLKRPGVASVLPF
jgi:hypothetical protein